MNQLPGSVPAQVSPAGPLDSPIDSPERPDPAALADSLLARWPLPQNSAPAVDLVRRYSESGRHYHDLRHLSEVLDRIDELRRAGAPSRAPSMVRLAAWYHDAIYDGAPEPERRSADLARKSLHENLSGPAIEEVARLVELTAEHRPSAEDVDGCLLSDADLAILAADPDRYAEYAAAVRREYSHVADNDFRRGRGAILRSLLNTGIYSGAAARQAWQARARANLERELEQLDGI
ncbi:MAG: hypothetical protein ACK5MT_14440 [Actinomycetales bacterium]